MQKYTVTLAQKVYSDRQIEIVDEFLKSTLKGLEVVTEMSGISSRRWIQLAVWGKDEKMALHCVDEKIGISPKRIGDLKRFSSVKAYVSSLGKRGLVIDIGALPVPIEVVVPLNLLQAQLVDGRKMGIEEMAELFSLAENMPLEISILSVSKESGQVEATLSEKQISLYRMWLESFLSRLIVLGASFDRIRLALSRAKHIRDAVNIESLGLFEHVIVCKLGTDAEGLIPRIGKRMPDAKFKVFNPREILKLFGDHWLS